MFYEKYLRFVVVLFLMIHILFLGDLNAFTPHPVNRDDGVGGLLDKIKSSFSHEELAEFVIGDLPLYYGSGYLQQTLWLRRGELFRQLFERRLEDIREFNRKLMNPDQEVDATSSPYRFVEESGELFLEEEVARDLPYGIFRYTLELADFVVEHVDLRVIYPYLEESEPHFSRTIRIKLENMRKFTTRKEFAAELWKYRDAVGAKAKLWMAESVLVEPRFYDYLIEQMQKEDDGYSYIKEYMLPLMELIRKQGFYTDEMLREGMKSKNSLLREISVCYICENKIRRFYLDLAKHYIEGVANYRSYSRELPHTDDFGGCKGKLPFENTGEAWEKMMEKGRNGELRLEDLTIREGF
jgi:hypothetical protein